MNVGVVLCCRSWLLCSLLPSSPFARHIDPHCLTHPSSERLCLQQRVALTNDMLDLMQDVIANCRNLPSAAFYVRLSYSMIKAFNPTRCDVVKAETAPLLCLFVRPPSCWTVLLPDGFAIFRLTSAACRVTSFSYSVPNVFHSFFLRVSTCMI